LIRLAKFFAKTTDRILAPNFNPLIKIEEELLSIRDIIATSLPDD